MTAGKTFYNKFKPAAISAAAGTKIFPETILAAAALESSNGLSELASRYNNFFGIKAGIEWQGKRVVMQTTEQRGDGTRYKIDAPFRVYDSPADSFRNYVQFISGPRYVRAGVLSAATPVAQFAALHQAGYATDISYVEKLKERLESFGAYIKENPTSTGLATVALFFLLYKLLIK